MSVLTNDELNSNIIRLEGRFDRVEELLENLTHAIDGNGRPGIRENMVRLDQRVQVLEQRDRENSVPRSIWIPLLFSILIGLAGLLVPLLHGGPPSGR